MASFPMTLNDPWPGIFGNSYHRTLIGNRTHRMVPPSMTLSDLSPGFHGYDIFEVKYLKNDASKGQTYYSILIRNHTWHIEWYNVWFPWLTSKRVARFVSNSWVFVYHLRQVSYDLPLCVVP